MLKRNYFWVGSCLVLGVGFVKDTRISMDSKILLILVLMVNTLH